MKQRNDVLLLNSVTSRTRTRTNTILTQTRLQIPFRQWKCATTMPIAPHKGCAAHISVKEDAPCDGERAHELECSCGHIITVCGSCLSVYLGLLSNACKSTNKGTHPQTNRDLIARARSNRYRAIPCPQCITRYMLPKRYPPKGTRCAKTTVNLVATAAATTPGNPLRSIPMGSWSSSLYLGSDGSNSSDGATNTAQWSREKNVYALDKARISAEIKRARDARMHANAVAAGIDTLSDAKDDVSQAAQMCLLAIGVRAVPPKNLSFFGQLDRDPADVDPESCTEVETEVSFEDALREQLRRVCAATKLLMDACEHINRAGASIAPGTAVSAPLDDLANAHRKMSAVLKKQKGVGAAIL